MSLPSSNVNPNSNHNCMISKKLLEIDEDFDLQKAYKKEINDGFINTVWLEDENWDSSVGVSDDNTKVSLQTAGKALIEFANGKHILIKNSEWCSFYII
jgi:hypothetical protein